MTEWRADWAVPPVLARAVIEARFPGFTVDTLVAFEEGWDNSVFLVNGEWLFRFPRRQAALEGVKAELAVLPELAPLLPLPVPVPVHVGAPGDDFPWPFFGYRRLPGREPARAKWDEGARAALAAPLARFLKALHGPEPFRRFAVGLRRDPYGRADLSGRLARTREKLGEMVRAGLLADAKPLLERLETWGDPVEVRHTSVVHGDLHFRHYLVGEGGALTGVIDWGDVQVNDPAVDMVAYWTTLPPSGREIFRREYGEVTDSQLRLARVLAVFLSAVLALYARDLGDEALLRECRGSLERVFSP